MIDTRLHVLRMVAERGTLTAAADDLGYTPSAVSHQLRTLAHDLGVRLLEPEGRNVRLTPTAVLLLERSHELFAAWESIYAEVRREGGSGLGHLYLAGFSTAASVLLPPVAAVVAEQFPGSTVRIIEAEPDPCFEMLLSGRADVAVVVATDPLPATDDRRFAQEPLMTDALDLLVPAEHPLAQRSGPVTLSDVADDPWIMDRPGRPYHQLATRACQAAGFTPVAAHEATEWATGVALVAAGLGVCLVPRLIQLPEGARAVRIPLRSAGAPVRHVRTSIRRGTAGHPEVALALSELRRVAADLSSR